MKAIVVNQPGEPDVMRIQDTADPQPGEGEVVVAIRAAGVNPVDTYIRAGRYNWSSYPYTPGMDGAGIVETVGINVTRVKPGDRVYVAGSLTGTYAEKSLSRQSQVHPLPDSLSFQQGAAINVPFATAWRALFQRGNAKPGETVLVHGGTGGVGTAAIQIGRNAGMRVVASGGTDRGRELAATQGAQHVLDHHAPDFVDMAVELTGGRGFDLILEMLANENLDKDLDMLAFGGRVVVIGNRGRVEIDPRKIMSRDASVCGMLLMLAPEHDLASIHAALGAGFANGTLKPVVGREFPLADAPVAHTAVMEPGAYGKIVLIP